MADPTTGLSVHEAATRLLTPIEPETVELETQPEVETTEDAEITLETSDAVVETEEAEEVREQPETTEAEPVQGETETFLSELNDWVKGKEHYENILIPTKVNGVESEVPLSEIVANHQISQASQDRLESLKAEKAQFEEERTNAQTAYNQQLSQAAELVTQLEKRLLGEAENVNWQELRETDPAEYSAKRQDLLERQQQLSQSKSAIAQEHQNKVNEAYNTLVQTNAERLVERFPEWQDETIAQQEKAQIREYLLGQGYSQVDVDGKMDRNGNILSMGVVDARAIAMAKKAMLFDQGKQALDVTKKKVKTLPKVIKPGKPVTSNEVDSDKARKMTGRLKKSGKVEDAAAIIKQRMFGG